jgi:hypothetical protein
MMRRRRLEIPRTLARLGLWLGGWNKGRMGALWLIDQLMFGVSVQ